ncbi:MAG: thioredoxin domain-containing protein, partial [Nanoarchaeota archaeon]
FASLNIPTHAASKIDQKEPKEQKKVYKENRTSHSKEERNKEERTEQSAPQQIPGSSPFSASPQPEYQAIDELVEDDDTNWRFALAVLTIFLLILLYVKFTSYGASGDVMTLDAYLDYASPYSRDMHAVLVMLQSEYGEKLWVEYHLVGTTDFHTLAASAVSCADAQQRKQEYLAYLFSVDGSLVTAQEFTAAAETLGLVSADFALCLSASDSSAYLQQQLEYEEVEILYTPTLVVNNKKIVGAVGFDAVKSVLDEQLLQLG